VASQTLRLVDAQHRPLARVTIAANPLTRARGLIARRLEAHHGLLLRRCTSVHTWAMSYAIDVVYLDEYFRVTRVDHALKPFRFSRGPAGTRHTLELAAGAARDAGLAVGDRLTIEEPLDAAA
jgi:uncharacterized protein